MASTKSSARPRRGDDGDPWPPADLREGDVEEGIRGTEQRKEQRNEQRKDEKKERVSEGGRKQLITPVRIDKQL